MNDTAIRITRCTATLAAFVALSSPVHAFSVGFSCAVSSQDNCAVGETQLAVEVADSGDGAVAFIFTNDSSAQSAIARIYIDDERRTLSGPPTIHQDAPDVIFETGVKPKNLPGAAAVTPAFNARPNLSVGAASPHRIMGVNPGEQIGLVYPLSPGRTFEDVISDLSVGNLRIGLHMVGFASAAGESFVSQVLLTETIECP